MSHWPYTDEELERLNFPERFKTPVKSQEKTKEPLPNKVTQPDVTHSNI